MTTRAAQSPVAKIVGIGAATCANFLGTGGDENLDLNPPKFGLLKQLGFLRQYCTINRSQDFSDAVLALYKMLRTHSMWETSHTTQLSLP
jgi:hypothetical protein